jgi:hypothetical protein
MGHGRIQDRNQTGKPPDNVDWQAIGMITEILLFEVDDI